MIINSKAFVQDKAICYIRHIRKLGGGYREDAYPKYIIVVPTKFYVPIDDLKSIDFKDYFKIEDDIPQTSHFGYPHLSKITYYIRLENVLRTFSGIDDFDTPEPYFMLSFLDGVNLYIYNTKIYPSLLDSLSKL